MNKQTYEFGEFLLDLTEKRLLRNGQTVSLQPKVFDMLAVFVEREGELVSRDDLMKAVWKETFVEETNLRFCVHALRKALGKRKDGKDYVETIPKRGYRFSAETSENFLTDAPDREISEEILLPVAETPKKQTANRKFLIAVAAILVLLIGVAAWQISKRNQPKNALDFQTLAVLPFESVGGEQTDLQIGLADALISNLSKIKRLKVLPLASIRKFAGQNFDAAAAGRELAAAAVLSGSYRFEGENMRVTVNLLRSADGKTLWTETFSTQKKSVLELENSIALRTARLLSLKIAEFEDEKSLDGKDLNAEAVQNYLSARKIQRTGELNRRKEMIGLFEKTVELEPSWALGYAGYAEALLTSDQVLVEWEKAEQVANKTLGLDKTLAEPHTVLGEIYRWRDWNWEKSELEFKQAIALNPNYAPAHLGYSQLLRLQRRFAEAEESLKKAGEIEPFSPYYQSSFCELYIFDRKFEKALAACDYANSIEPDFWRVRKLFHSIYVEKKMYPELENLVLGKLSPAEKAAHPLTKSLEQKDLRPYFQFFIDEPSKSGRENFVAKAILYLQIGEKEKALEKLENAFARRDANFPAVNGDSSFDSIRSEKRFVELMRKTGLHK